MLSKLEIFDKIAPPNQQENFQSAGASTFGSIVEGAKAEISFFILSFIPQNIVDPPARTIPLKRSFLMSVSHFIIESKVNL